MSRQTQPPSSIEEFVGGGYDSPAIWKENVWDKLDGDNPYVAGLVEGVKWGKQDPDENIKISLDYQFINVPNIDIDGTTYATWSNSEKNAAINAMAAYSDVGNLSFSHKADITTTTNPYFDDSFQPANIVWILSVDELGPYGASYLPYPDWYYGVPLGGAVDINKYAFSSSYSGNTSLEPGSNNFVTFTHELGHALGLKHPHSTSEWWTSGNGYGSPFPGIENPTEELTESGEWPPAWTDGGDNGLNATPWTVMTYNNIDANQYAPSLSDTNGYLTGIGAFDIAAIQYLYGPNQSNKTGDDTYSLDLNLNGFQSIWDAAGNDTIDASSSTGSVTIDLRNATLENEPGGGGFVSQVDGQLKGYTIAYNSTGNAVIENAKGSAYGDYLRGNSSNNTLDGQAGFDTASFSGNIGEYNLSLDGSSGAFQVADNIQEETTSGGGYGSPPLIEKSSRDGTDQLFNVERLNFNGSTYDFPTDITLSATSFDENLTAGTAIASLSATDPDSGNNHSFSFLSGTGSQDNSFFSISGNQLVINKSADYETKDSYSIRLQASDVEGLAVAKSFALGVNDLDDQKTYSLTTSSNQVNEGQVLTSTISTSYVDPGTTVYWQLSGNNITADDLESGELEGSEQVNDQGRASFTNTLKLDRKTEGNENLQVKIFTDSARTIQVADTASIAINDTSLDPTYTLSTSASQVDEGQELTTTITTTEVDPGTTLYWQLRGNNITANDLEAGELEGSTQVDSQGKASFDHTFAEDLSLEGPESFNIKLFSDQINSQLLAESSTVQINDTSTTAPPSTPDLIATSDSGISNSDDITNDNTPSFSGTAKAGTSIELFADGISLGSSITDNNSNWAYTVPNDNPLADGSIAITSTSTEASTVLQRTAIPLVQRFSTSRTYQEYRNMRAFAALKDDGSVITWGDPAYGGDSSSVDLELSSSVSQIFSSAKAFAAVKDDGSVVTWGDTNYGGDSSSVDLELSSGVNQIFSTGDAFAALKDDGSVVTWGNPPGGGDSSSVDLELSSGVNQIFSAAGAFAALKDDGSVITWGNPAYGGDSSSVDLELSSGVNQIFSANYAFAAVKDDGSVVSWGHSDRGGDNSSVDLELSSGVNQIFSAGTAFAAVKDDGSVVTWGDPNHGGDSSSVAADLRSGVNQIFSTYEAFAAVKDDGSVVTWGNPNHGGDSSSVELELSSGVNQIFNAGNAFAALKDDGSVVTWGTYNIKDAWRHYGIDSSSVELELSSGVNQIFSTYNAFATLKDDGSVITWGREVSGGDSSRVADQLSSGVIQIFSAGNAFAALKDDGSVVTWGNPPGGGDSSSVADQLSSGVVSFADPFHDDRLTVTYSTSDPSDPSDPLNLTIDATAPAFSSGDTATPIEENSGAAQVIYTAAADDASDVSYSLKQNNSDDAAYFSIDASTGKVSLKEDPDYETNPSYSFSVSATDVAGNNSEQEVSLGINNIYETYILNTSSNALNEGEALTTNITTIDVSEGSTLFWSLTGEIDQQDLSEGQIEGSSQVDSQGKATFSHTLAADRTTEGNESLQVKLFSDSQRSDEVAQSASIIIQDTSKSPTYSLTTTTTHLEEGDVVTTRVNTNYVDPGTELYWQISGNNIDQSDFSSGELSGSGTVELTNNIETPDLAAEFSFSHTLAEDLKTEDLESFQIKLFSDPERTKEVVAPRTIEVVDTSKEPLYELTTSSQAIDEGDILTTTVSTTYVEEGTELHWSLTGENINQDDLAEGQLQGSGQVDSEGKFSFSHTLAKDAKTEGDETLGIKLFTDSNRNQAVAGTTWAGIVADVQIRDTSQPPTYELTTSSSSIEEGQVLTTNVSTGFVEPGTELHWSLSGTGINQGDFKEGNLSGSGQTDADGKFSFSHTLRNDQTREGPESLDVKLFTDALRSEQVGNTASVEIKDTSMSTHYVRRGDSAYVVIEGPSWQEAEAYAQSIGGNLVTINDAAENEWLMNAFKGEPSNSLHIGLKENSNDDDHEWASEETSLYRNWEAGEPNGLNDGNADQTAEFYLNSGRWNDHPNVETKGIAEISLARSNPNIAQSWEPPLAKQWTRLLGGSLQSMFDSVVTGRDGSIYIGGEKSVNDSNWSDALIAKYDSDGSTDWTRLLGSNKDERSYGISATSDGSIYIAGYTSGDLDEQINSGGTSDVLLAKYDTDGNKAWSDIFGSSLLEYAFGVTTTNDGSIYIAGETYGDLDGQINRGGGTSDAFLSKYDVDGTRKWTRLLGSHGSHGSHGSSEVGWFENDSARAITSASDGSIYITGYTTGDLDGQKVNGNGNNDYDAFLAKYDTKGNRSWTKQWGSSGYDYGNAIATDREGSIYIAGSTTGDIDGISNQSTYDVEDAFVSKFDSNGEKQWTRLLGSTGTDQAHAITTDSEGSIYISGITNGNLDGNTNNNSPRSGGHDSFLSKYDAAGNKQWTQLFGSSGNDRAKAITRGSDGSIYIAGMTDGDLDAQANTTGSWSGFLTKYAPAYSLTPDSDLELSYSLHSINGTDTQTDLKQLAVLGDSVDWQDTYRLDITAKSLAEGYDLETADITINFDPFLFNEIKASDIKISGNLPIANAVRIDNDVGTIRIAAASLGDLDPGDLYGNHLADAGASIGADGAVLASIELDFNEFRLDTLTQNSNGKILDPSTPLFFGLSANQDETVFSKALDDGSGLANREIKSLRDLGGDLAVDGTKVTLYEAAINLEEQGDGLILSTERVIGSYNPISTNLVRSGATISTTSTWTNVGNIEAQNIQVTGITNSNAQLLEDQSYFAYKGIGANGDQLTRNSLNSLNSLNSGRFSSDTGEFDSTAQESGELHAAIKITGAAGNVVDLGLGIASLQADGSDLFSNQKGSKNLITYQGDLNYDGRVSMKDLAYLNAGAARQQQVSAADNATEVDANNDGVVDASVATAVDANFDGQISMADLAVIDADWGQSLHQQPINGANGSESSFTGSDQISWEQLDSQGLTGDAAWDNQAFKDQNALEAGNDFVESLESPAAVGVIGGDGNSDSSDNDIAGDHFQDPLST
ncbi:SBBP repeat-containing protein [Prochlorococcus marinus]|uniref:SBBP repeat-containing protein n=2 Tax=Prochlorococcaceae TaxID=2881426 RepID=UPI0007BBB775|nr:SBBP repeat-containing protein [Prochlorococcus marinus]KZR72726.1 Serralysin [Prochlorococcus marinus str. MIT 1312]